jgi:hypothetical protein
LSPTTEEGALTLTLTLPVLPEPKLMNSSPAAKSRPAGSICICAHRTAVQESDEPQRLKVRAEELMQAAAASAQASDE